jgi:hypothetical protein
MTVEQLEKELENIEPTTGIDEEPTVDWQKYLDMPLERYTPDEIIGLSSLIDYPLAGDDPERIRPLIEGKKKYYKAAVQRLRDWYKEA